MDGTDKPLTGTDVSKLLNVGNSTLRKWCIFIEEQGYSFPRTDNNKRLFFKHDLEVLKRYKKYVQVNNIPTTNAAKLVIEDFEGVFTPENEQKNSENTVLEAKNENELVVKLLEHIRKQEDFNQALLKRLDEQKTYIEEKLERRDQYLLESLKQSMETRKGIEEKTKDDVGESTEEKKSFWAKLFR